MRNALQIAKDGGSDGSDWLKIDAIEGIFYRNRKGDPILGQYDEHGIYWDLIGQKEKIKSNKDEKSRKLIARIDALLPEYEKYAHGLP